MKLKLNVKSIIFDMDGVITDTMPDHFLAWKQTLCDIDIDISEYDVYAHEGQPGIHFLEQLFKKKERKYNYKLAIQLLEKKEALFKSNVKRQFIPGIYSFLEKLHNNQFKLSLVTGTSYDEMCQILPEKFRRFFSVIITGNDVKHGKPHPEPYQKSLNRLEISSGQGVVIENAPFGIRSAKAAGLKCLALETSLSKIHLREADGIYQTISDLQNNVQFLQS